MSSSREGYLELMAAEARERVKVEALAAALQEQKRLHRAAGDRELLPEFVNAYLGLVGRTQSLSLLEVRNYAEAPMLFATNLAVLRDCLLNLEDLAHEHRHRDERLRGFVASLLRFRGEFLGLATPPVMRLDLDAGILLEGYRAETLASVLSGEESMSSFALRLLDAVDLDREGGPEFYTELLMRYATI